MEIKDAFKSFFLGVLFAGLAFWDSLACFTGERTHVKGAELSPKGAISLGFLELGMALIIHAFFFHFYENHRRFKLTLVCVGSASVLLGFLWLPH